MGRSRIWDRATSAGHCPLDIGRWPLDVGHWPLDIGCRVIKDGERRGYMPARTTPCHVTLCVRTVRCVAGVESLEIGLEWSGCAA